jgi:hypothetical protein
MFALPARDRHDFNVFFRCGDARSHAYQRMTAVPQARPEPKPLRITRSFS